MPQNMPHSSSAAASVSASSTPSVWLEVARGRTRHPRRPVLQSRFLIGAGSNCPLQLGGEGIPFLHSMLLIEQGDVMIESFVASPPLLLNGYPVRTALLRDGDLLAIGEFEFSLHIDTVALDKERSFPIEADEEATSIEEEDLSELSAAELVNRLEAEMDDIEELEDSQRAGVAALLDAVWLAGESTVESESTDTMADSLTMAQSISTEPTIEESGDEEALLEEMLELSHELESRLEQLRREEAVQAGRGESLMDAQEQLVEQLARLAGTLKSQDSMQTRARA